MRIELGSRTVKIVWQHKNEQDSLKRGSFCQIFEEKGEELVPIAIGRSFVMEQDNFDKRKGRKISLRRALCRNSPSNGNYVRKEIFSREESTIIWNEINSLSKK